MEETVVSNASLYEQCLAVVLDSGDEAETVVSVASPFREHIESVAAIELRGIGISEIGSKDWLEGTGKRSSSSGRINCDPHFLDYAEHVLTTEATTRARTK